MTTAFDERTHGRAPDLVARGSISRFAAVGKPLLVLVWIPLAVLLQLLRSSHTPVWDAVWAEDGRFSYGEARAHGAVHTVFLPIAGYLQVAPRGLAEIASQLPLVRAAEAMSGLAAGTAALLSVYVFVTSRPWLPRLWQRGTLAALVVLHPAAAFEVNAALNNVHWYLMFAAFWACLSPAKRPVRKAVDVAVVLVSTLSDPLTGLLLPLVAVRAWRRRGSAVWTGAALVLGLVLQYALAVSRAAPTHSPRSSGDIPILYGLRVVGSFLIGDSAIKGRWDANGGWFVLVAVLVAVALFGVAVVAAPRTVRLLLGVLLAYSVAFYVVPVGIRGGTAPVLAHPANLLASRYTILPLWLLYSALIVAAGVPGLRLARTPSASRATAWLAPGLTVALLTVQLVLNFATAGPRTSGTSWRLAAEAARPTCELGILGQTLPGPPPPAARPRLIRPGVVALPVAPGGHLFWAARFRCSQL
jgi:hypothetical protein